MNIPFPVIYPPLLDGAWFLSDSAVDEEAELTAMELAQKKKLNRVTLKYKKAVPKPRTAPEPMEEVESDEGNEESDESEDSRDGSEEERGTYSPNQLPVEPTTPITIPDSNDTTNTETVSESEGWT